MNKRSVRVGFIGAGSIGSLFGGYLADIKSDIYSIEVIFFCMKNHANVIKKKGLKVYRDQKVNVIKNIRAFENEESIEDILVKDMSFEFDFIFLTTKTYDIKTAILQYNKIIKASNYLVILQNGIGNEDIVVEYCNRANIIRAVTTNGALLEKPGHLIHTGQGITKIGFPFLMELNLEERELDQAKSFLMLLRDILNLANLETIIVEDIIKECWEKALVNIGINAIGALTRLTNGELLKIEELRYFIEQAINEAMKVAEMKNIILSKKDYVSITYGVLKKTANNKNSMLQDVLNRRTTEIDFLNGRILSYAENLGIKVPINELLTYLIRGLGDSII